MIQKRFMKSEEILVLSAMMTAKSLCQLGQITDLWRGCLYLSIFHPPSLNKHSPNKNTQQAARCHRLIHGNGFCCLPFTDPKLFHWATRILACRGIQHQLGTNNGISQDLTLSTSRISRACENGWKMMGVSQVLQRLQLNSTRRS